MQSVSAAFTAEERDSIRNIVQSTLISWHKYNLLGNRTFTIGVSLIGGSDVIGPIAGAIGSPGNYKYFDETQYVTELTWERGLNVPVGGLSKGLAEVKMDNTSRRFTPRYMGGHSELYTAILPRRPMVINAGFNIGGAGNTLAQFSGIINKQPALDMKNRTIDLQASDYVDFFENRYMDNAAIYTGQRTDQIIASMLAQQGMTTAQYDLDTGINTPPFVFADAGAQFSDIINKLVQAESGNFYQDESGIFKFENRQHWDTAPYNAVQRIIYTSQVLESNVFDIDNHLINVVEVKGIQYAKQPLGVLINSTTVTPIFANSTVTLFYDYQTPVLQITPPTIGGANSFYIVNGKADGTGSDQTNSVSIKSMSNFSTTSTIIFQNNSTQDVYLTKVVIAGRYAKKVADIYTRLQDDSSVTAYQQQPYVLENDYIQNSIWANTLARMILNDFSNPESIQHIVIRAIPELQLGDLISWQGRYWRVFNIRAQLGPAQGFIQELTLLQRTIQTYFRIGVSTIGSKDKISP